MELWVTLFCTIEEQLFCLKKKKRILALRISEIIHNMQEHVIYLYRQKKLLI